MAEQSLPHSLDAEQAVLGEMLFDNTLHSSIDWLRPEDFYDPVHGRIYAVAAELIAKGALADGVTLKNRFERDEGLAEIGGVEYLADLMDKAAPASMALEYARLVQDYARKRDLIRIGEEMIAAASGDGPDHAEQIAAAEGALFTLAQQDREKAAGALSLAKAMRDAYRVAESARRKEHPKGVVYTGLRALDNKLRGLRPGNLYVLAGRPGSGKTSIALVAAQGAVQARTGSALFFSLEMSAEQLGMRALGRASRLAYSDLYGGKYSEADRIDDVLEGIASQPLWIDDRPGLTTAQMLVKARRFARRMADTPTPLRLIVLDHLGRVHGSRKEMSEFERVSATVEGLKDLSKELGLPVLALCQLSRKVEERNDKRPMLSDLRQSGRIEEEADAVLMVYREAYYAGQEKCPNSADKQAEWADRVADKTIEIGIPKNRHGPDGKIELWGDMATNAITDKPADDGREYAA